MLFLRGLRSVRQSRCAFRLVHLLTANKTSVCENRGAETPHLDIFKDVSEKGWSSAGGAIRGGGGQLKRVSEHPVMMMAT